MTTAAARGRFSIRLCAAADSNATVEDLARDHAKLTRHADLGRVQHRYGGYFAVVLRTAVRTTVTSRYDSYALPLAINGELA